MAFTIGIVLALVVAGFARSTGFDRDRTFYSTLVIVVASYYVLFAAVSGSTHALVVESLVMAAFAAIAVLGFKFSPWLIVAGLAAHGVFDGDRCRARRPAPDDWVGGGDGHGLT